LALKFFGEKAEDIIKVDSVTYLLYKYPRLQHFIKHEGGLMTYSLKLIAVSVIILALPSFAFAAKTHRVKKNETVHTLAKKYHVTVEELKSTTTWWETASSPGRSWSFLPAP
jgi:hypothetical protein